jgi:prepilin signal peptidase PulO-like enzyme (type II secretory pathway)
MGGLLAIEQDGDFHEITLGGFMSPIVFFTVFAFFFGGAVGSFLNVVVWRLPAGMSLSHPGSHCPLCGHPIRWYDNVPILGWILLRGKCRDCKAGIAVRYPIVEAIVAVAFLLLFLSSWGAPFRPAPPVDPILAVEYALENLVGMFVLEAVLIATLFAAALIARDGHVIPLRTFSFALILGVVVPSVWPESRTLSLFAGSDVWSEWANRTFFSNGTPVHQGVLDGLAGAAFALVVGGAASFALRSTDRTSWRLATLAVGLIAGWQITLAALIASSLTYMIAKVVGLAESQVATQESHKQRKQPNKKIEEASTRGFGPIFHLTAWTFVALCVWPVIFG